MARPGGSGGTDARGLRPGDRGGAVAGRAGPGGHTDFGLVNKALMDLGIISKPVLWLGVDADRSMLAIITSVVWKVIGFGMILFMGAIQAIPREINEASLVDGASYWQRVTRVILPLTLRTVLLVTLVSVIGSLLAFDQFYIMTAGQPQNETATSVFYVYLNSFPYLKLGYGAALSMILALTILVFTVVQLLLTRRSHG
jgi:ABC-type sugar transport system permease subunit